MRHYCTLFDSKYLPQGLALYESLKRHSSEPFFLYILAMDEECKVSLRTLGLPRVVIIPLEHFRHSSEIWRIQASRTWGEYCWTCASNFTLFLGPPAEITYLDADTFFFSDPEQVFAEIGEKSIGIIPHRFPPHRKYMEANGKFNVSWVTFKGPIGFQCLEKWARQCREKCSAKEGCGDQKYLDSWPSDYPGEVCEIQNIGVGAAPWNLSQYRVHQDGHVMLDGPKVYLEPLIMYHFHEYQHGKRLTNYKLRKEDRDLIYAPYIEAVDEANKILEVKIEKASV